MVRNTIAQLQLVCQLHQSGPVHSHIMSYTELLYSELPLKTVWKQASGKVALGLLTGARIQEHVTLLYLQH